MLQLGVNIVIIELQMLKSAFTHIWESFIQRYKPLQRFFPGK